MKHRIYIIAILAAYAFAAYAVPAYPTKIRIATADNDSIWVNLRGDESCKYATTDDNRLLIPGDNAWHYADSETITRQTVRPKARRGRSFANPSQQPLVGEHHTLVILMQFSDTQFRRSKEMFERLFNEIGFSIDRAQGSVRDYFSYASYGQFDCIADIYGPYTASYSMDYYGGNDYYGSDKNPMKLAVEAVKALPKDIDLSKYDIDGDGTIENFHIIFAGYGEEAGASASAIWSHENPNPLSVVVNGYRFAGYSCSPELRDTSGIGISRIGVICHEMSHAFGANDYYDVDYENYGEFTGTGVWDIMAGGCWNNDGISPANINPYVKTHDFGWIIPREVATGNVQLSDYNRHPEVLKLPTNDPNDYYLAEYRRLDEFDASLPAEGLLIYHVHPLIEDHRYYNDINSTSTQHMYIVNAAYTGDTFKTHEYGEIDSDGTPFPGAAMKTAFTPWTTPRAFAWNGCDAEFAITDISIEGQYAAMTIRTQAETSEALDFSTVVYTESFEGSTMLYTSENSKGSARWKVDDGTFLSTHPKPAHGAKHMMLYNSVLIAPTSESTLTSPSLELDTDSIYQLSFKYCNPRLNASSPAALKCEIELNNSNYWQTVMENRTTEYTMWQEFTALIPRGASSLRFRFTGTIFRNGAFIDDIRINVGKEPSAAETITADRDDIAVYSPSGVCVYRGPAIDLGTILPSGIYIVASGNARRKVNL